MRRENLTAANALLNFMRYMAQIAGLVVLAPLLTRTAGVDVLFVTTGSLFAAAAVYSALIPMGVVAPHERLEFPDEAARPRARGLREARQFLTENREVCAGGGATVAAGGAAALAAGADPDLPGRGAGPAVSDLPVVIIPAVVGMLLGLRLVAGIARGRGVGGLARAGLVVFIAAVVALSLVDVLEESLGSALSLTRIDLGFVEISPESQIVMIILLPMGFAFSLVNVAANAVLNARVPGGMQGRVFALQSVLAGVASVPPLLAGGGLTEILDVRIVLGLSPVVLVFAWMWSHWGTPDPVAAWRRRALQRSSP